MATQLYINQTNQPFTLQSLISPGKNSVRIFKAVQRSDNQQFAIKVFQRKKGDSPSPHYIQEHKIASKIKHPHILDYHEFHHEAQFKQFKGPFLDCSVIAMEYLPNGDLFNLVQKQACSEKLARTFLHQMVQAIEYLHEKEGIVHLDIKLENFLTYKQGLKLIDFDFSHMEDEILSEGMHGTPGYRAPELLNGKVSSLKSVDIYSLGIVLFTMVVGWAPYEEIEEKKDVFTFDKYYETFRSEPAKFWEAHENHLRSSGRDSSDILSSNFKDLVQSLLHENPQRRPTITKVKESKWYKGEVYTQTELEEHMSKTYGIN